MTPEQALAFHRALLNTFDTAVMVSDDSGHYVEVNDATCRLLGARREDVVDRHVIDFLPAGVSRADVELQWRAFLRDGVADELRIYRDIDISMGRWNRMRRSCGARWSRFGNG